MAENEQSFVQKAYSDIVSFVKRKLSKLQKAYKEFFSSMLKKYEVDSPAELNDDQKHVFFNDVEEGWKVRKEEVLLEIKEEFPDEEEVFEEELLEEVEITADKLEEDVLIQVEKRKEISKKKELKEKPIKDEVKQRLKKSQYATVKISRPSIAIEPSANCSTLLENKNEDDVIKICSEENADQTDELKINFHPNQFFEQAKLYSYPVVKMPTKQSFLKLPRKGRAMGKGYKETDFLKAIIANIPEMEVDIDLHMVIPHYNRPYEPDFVLTNRELNLYIDIEIDEPYDGYYRFPTHEKEKDDTRDLFFTESGWVVIRFTERQIHLQEMQCIAYIKDVINSLVNYSLEETSNCISENKWDYQQAVIWSKEHYREKYLGIEKFAKQILNSEILLNLYESEDIEKRLNRTIKYKTDIHQDNIAFEDETHKYHHPKDETGNAEYISVTTLIERFFPFDMDRFIQVKAKREGRSEEEVLEEFIAMRDEASEKGTYMHEQIEFFLKGKEYDGNSKEFAMFEKFYQEVVVAKGFEFVEAEKRILLGKYNVAGTIDALFKKPNKEEYIIVDWKRSRKLIIDGHPKKYGYGYALSELDYLYNSSYYKYALQQNIYKYILEKEYNMPVSTMNLIVLHEKFDKYHRVNLINMNKEVSIIINSIYHKI